MSNDIELLKSMLSDIFGDDEYAIDSAVDEYKEKFLGVPFESIHIGSNGFAMLGDPEYHEKQQIEFKIILSYIFETIGNPPDNSYFKWKDLEHDFGIYHELFYECSLELPEHKKYLEKLDNLDLECEELTNRISNYYNDYKQFNDFKDTLK